jgi:hypothetical protein
MTSSGIEPATFRFVAQYLNHCATISGPPESLKYGAKLASTALQLVMRLANKILLEIVLRQMV